MEFNKDILKDVAEELELKFEEDEEEVEEENLEDDESDDVDIEDEDLELEDEEDEEEELEDDDEETETSEEEVVETKTKPTKEEKAQYAFEELRKKAESAKSYEKQLNEIASMYGFTDSKEMLDKLQKDAISKKAKEQGIDPKIYQEWQETKKQLEEMRKEREQERANNKIQKVLSQIDIFVKKNNLSEQDKSELIDKLDEDGFTIDTLSTIKNHEKIFAGYVSDKIIEKEKQKMLEKETKRKKLQEDKLETSGASKGKVNMDTLVEALLKTRR